MIDILRDRLGRSWQGITGARGGGVPRAAQELVPVVVVDDHSRGPYATGRRWFGSATVAAIAANFSVVMIGNTDDPVVKKGSRVLIERVAYRMFAASALIVAFNDNSYLPASFVLCEEMATGDNKVPANGTSGRQPVGGPGIVGVNSAGAAGVFEIDTNDSLLHDILDFYAELGPGQTHCFRAGTLNVGMTVTAWGRYYEPA